MGIMRQLITPFYKTRTNRIKARNAQTKDNVATIKRHLSEREYVKQLKRDGILK